MESDSTSKWTVAEKSVVVVVVRFFSVPLSEIVFRFPVSAQILMLECLFARFVVVVVVAVVVVVVAVAVVDASRLHYYYSRCCRFP